jgi:hypothetical protein
MGDESKSVFTVILFIISLFLFSVTFVHAGQNPNARFLHIELPGENRILSLAEVEVYCGTQNIAMQGIARQINTANRGDAGRAIDGNISGHYFEHSVTHTMTQGNVWWELDFGAEYEVNKIRLYNRTDCCGERINPARVLLMNNARKIIWEDAIIAKADKYNFDVEKQVRIQPKISPNLLRNADFRQQTNPLIPDYWYLHPSAAIRIRDLYKNYKIDPDIQSPVPGTHVLKLTNSLMDFRHMMLIPRQLFTRLPKGGYTFSVYIKADRDNTTLHAAPGWSTGKEAQKSLSTKWKRYTFNFNQPVSRKNSLQPVLRFPKKGTYLIAAPQLEMGPVETAFQPCYEDIRSRAGNHPATKVAEKEMEKILSQKSEYSNSILVKGKPFYIIGIVAYGALPEWYLKEIKEQGINTLFYYRMPNSNGQFDGKTISDFKDIIFKAAKQGLKVVVGMSVAGSKPPDWRERMLGFASLVNRLKKYPAIIGWYPVDEPAAHTWTDNELIEFYNTIKQIDPDRFVFSNWAHDGVPLKAGQPPCGTLDSTDIYSISYYPFAGQERSLDGYSKAIFKALTAARAVQKSSHSWLQLYGGMDAWREPTKIELNYMAYLNFVSGSMISYWETKSNSELNWRGVKAISHQGAYLSKLLFLNPDSSEILPPSVKGDFIYSGWKNGETYYLILVNNSKISEEFECHVSILTETISLSNIRSLFNQYPVRLENGLIKETIPPLGTRVYELSK